ncbi:MAG TPA: alkaline phosphatase family protein [Candidatus Angelobacter sp.]|jgi:phospholipase C|nr:alkaline phosphatase family protein [Candidatus Angelobacter sp.]
MGNISRRAFLRAAGAAGLVAATGGIDVLTNATRARAVGPLPPPGQSGIEHIVVVCMENRSFDHYLGWVPGATGQQSGLSYLDDSGVAHPTHRLTDTWTGCGFNDPDHSYDGARTQFDNGAIDGFRRGANDDYALGYYTAADIPFHAALVKQFSICDHWFASFLGPTFPNRMYTHAAGTDRIDNNLPVIQGTSLSTMPTIWDRLSAAGVSANYYFSDEPFLALWGTKYLPISLPSAAFFAQAATGTLPSYSYLDPGFVDEESGSSYDDHPHSDIRRGEAFLGRVVNALISSPCWSKTVLVITYDEWGGFFDTVVPPVLPADTTTSLTGEPAVFDHNKAGFRVPAYVISPFSPVGGIDTTQYDHTSILKLVEWRFGLSSLTPRDSAANNPAAMLDFTAPNLNAPLMPLIPDPGPHVCEGGMDLSSPVWPDFGLLPSALAIKQHCAALGTAISVPGAV